MIDYLGILRDLSRLISISALRQPEGTREAIFLYLRHDFSPTKHLPKQPLRLTVWCFNGKNSFGTGNILYVGASKFVVKRLVRFFGVLPDFYVHDRVTDFQEKRPLFSPACSLFTCAFDSRKPSMVGKSSRGIAANNTT